jgi:hypothetical protein
MERLEDYNPLLIYAVGAVTLCLLYYVLGNDPEAAVPYNVAPPEQVKPGWEGEELQELSMKVISCECR